MSQQMAFSIDTRIAVSAEVNQDINNRPSPIVVRIFELKNLGIYTESDFYDLFETYLLSR
jgi:type VI secretion system protein VasD